MKRENKAQDSNSESRKEIRLRSKPKSKAADASYHLFLPSASSSLRRSRPSAHSGSTRPCCGLQRRRGSLCTTEWSPRRIVVGLSGCVFGVALARSLSVSRGPRPPHSRPPPLTIAPSRFTFFKQKKTKKRKNSKPEELVHTEAASSAEIPLIRRFSGGGTVLLGPGCVWATLVGGEEHLPPEIAGRGPRPLMEWTERVWGPVFGRIGDFKLREHGSFSSAFFLPLFFVFSFASTSRESDRLASFD